MSHRRPHTARVLIWSSVVSILALGASRGPSAQRLSPFEIDAVPDEILVQFEPDVREDRRAAARAIHRARLVRRFDALRVERLQLPAGAQAAVLRALRSNSDVRAVQPNYVRRLSTTEFPDDTYWKDGSLWGLRSINAPAAWDAFGSGHTTVVLANIDTGVNYTHPDLAGNIWTNPGEIPANGVDDDGNGYVDDVHGIDTANGDSDPIDDHGHGTHTAGTAAAVAHNGTGVVGVSWNVRVLPCKFIHASGFGTDAAAIECFNYVVGQKIRGANIRVTGNSWGSVRNGDVATVLKNAIDAAGDAGILNVFAAGNSGANNDVLPVDPASFTSPSILSVAATDEYYQDRRVFWSNYGPESVDLAAPGVNILSTYHDWYASLSGTSMAAAHAAGAAALVLAHAPALTVSETKAALMRNVDVLPDWDGVVAAGGRLNVFRSLLEVTSSPTPDVPVGGNPSASRARPVPGLIEAEDFDEGDAAVTYVDATPGNEGGACRATDVDIEPTNDSGGGCNIGWMHAGEWLQYTVDVARSGRYVLELRVAAPGEGGTFHIEIDGTDRTGPLRIPDTGGWQNWESITTTLSLEAGISRLRVVLDTNGWSGWLGNLNWLRLVEASAPSETIVIQAEDFDDGGAGAGYVDLTPGNDGSAYRATDVDIEPTGDTTGGFNIGWTRAGEWLAYTIDVGAAGAYTLEGRVAAMADGASFHVEVGGVDVTGPLRIPNTGGWQIWRSVSTTVTLPAGRQRLRVLFDAEAWDGTAGNLDYLRLTRAY